MIVIGVPLQVLFAFGIGDAAARAKAGVGVLPHGLLPARAGAAGGRHARVRLPAEPGHRAGQHGPRRRSASPGRCGSATRAGRSRRWSCSASGASATPWSSSWPRCSTCRAQLYEAAEIDGAAPGSGCGTSRCRRSARDAVRGGDRGDRTGCSTSPRPTWPATWRPARPRRPATPPSSSATRRARRCSIRSAVPDGLPLLPMGYASAMAMVLLVVVVRRHADHRPQPARLGPLRGRSDERRSTATAVHAPARRRRRCAGGAPDRVAEHSMLIALRSLFLRRSCSSRSPR